MFWLKKLRKNPSKKSYFKQFKLKLYNRFLRHKHIGVSLELKHNTIYVFPSKLGCSFFLIALLNFVLGINYQNNLILVTAYLMFTILVFAILIAYTNIKGLKINYQAKQNDYSPASPRIYLSLMAKTSCNELKILYANKVIYYTEHVFDTDTHIVSLPYTQRGCYLLKRLKLLSHYPFGLISSWSYLQIVDHVCVYPEKINSLKTHTLLNKTDYFDGTSKQILGTAEFDALKHHKQGMGLQRVSWKHYAKTQQLMVKEFIDFSSTPIIFDYSLLNGNTESRLSQLSLLVSQAHSNNQAFALKINTQFYPIDSSDEHLLNCLTALSCFKSPESDENE